MEKYRKTKRAFTLVELVVVLVILAILVGIALPSFMGARGRAYRAEALQIMSEIKVMGWGYRLQYGTETDSGWSSITGGFCLDAFEEIGYPEGLEPETDNWEFNAKVRANGIYTQTGVSDFPRSAPFPVDCDENGLCFIVEAIPITDSPADRAGAEMFALVMNYTGESAILYK